MFKKKRQKKNAKVNLGDDTEVINPTRHDQRSFIKYIYKCMFKRNNFERVSVFTYKDTLVSSS